MKLLKSPRLMLSVSMLIFGTIGVFVRNIPAYAGEIALYRAVMAAVILGIFFMITGQKIPFKNIKKEIPLLLFSGMAMGVNWILLFESYNYTTVSVATLSYYFAPVIVTVVCPFLFKEKLTAMQIVCFVASTAGIVMITGIGDMSQGSDHLKGILLALGAAVLYATVILINKFIKNVEGLHRTFLQFIAAIVILVPYVALTSGITVGTMNAGGWICLVIVGVLHTGVTYCLYFTALKDIPGQEAAILSYIDPLTAVIASVALLGETMSITQIIGGVLILGFTLWNEISAERVKKNGKT